jgi:D-alanine transaminase/branched-chain amino acid aminotransferase
MQRGYAIFDFCRTVNGVPLFMHDYLDRFYASAAAVHLKVKKSREELVEIIHELIKRSSLAEAGIRIMLTGGYSADGYHAGEPNLLITCKTVKVATSSDFEKGLSIITYEHQRELSHIKSINYLTGVWLQPLLKERHADDVLYYQNNIITEFSRSNIFIITRDNKLATPSRNILHGITRKKVISLAKEIMPVEERDISIDELINAREVFSTATTRKVLPVIKINDKFIGDGRAGAITTTLYQKFLQMEQSAILIPVA